MTRIEEELRRLRERIAGDLHAAGSHIFVHVRADELRMRLASIDAALAHSEGSYRCPKCNVDVDTPGAHLCPETWKAMRQNRGGK